MDRRRERGRRRAAARAGRTGAGPAARRRSRRGLAVIALALVLPSHRRRLRASRVAASAEASAPAGFLRAEGRIITDGDGNQVLLRGVNVNQLVDFYRRAPTVDGTRPLTEDDFAGIAEQGFNVVRLNLSWSALEPERGELDADYLEQITDAVGWAKKHGVYTVLDMHQDSLVQRRDRGGDRVPARHRPDVGLRRSARVGDDHRRRAALPVPGARHLAGRQPRVPALLLRHRRHPDRARRDLGQARRGLRATSRRSRATTCSTSPASARRRRSRPRTCSAATTIGRSRQIRAAGAPQIVFVEPSILWSGLGFDSGPPPGFTNDREHRLLAAPLCRVAHDGPLARHPADRGDGPPVRPRAARRRQLRRAALVGRVRLLGRRRGRRRPPEPLRGCSRTRTCSAAPTGCGSRPAATRRTASAPPATGSWCRTARPATTRPRGTTCSRS